MSLELVFAAGVALVSGFFTRLSGWDALSERYGAVERLEGKMLSKQTVQVGAVRWRSCVTVGIGPEGLYLELPSRRTLLARLGLFRTKPMLVPWAEFRPPEQATLFQLGAMKLSIGNPVVGDVVVYRTLFEQMQHYLPGP